MGTVNSAEDFKSSSGALSRQQKKFDFSGIRDVPKSSIFSCLCNNSDPQIVNEINSPHKESISNYPNNRRQSSLQIQYSTNEDNIIQNLNENIAENKQYKLVSTVVQQKHKFFTPSHKKQSMMFDSSNQSSFFSNSSRLSQNSRLSNSQTSFRGSSLFSKNSINASASVKNYKKDLQISKNSIYEIDDFYEDVPSSFSKDTVMIRGEKKYKGEILNGKPHGYGKEIWPDGSKYEGMFVEGLRTGQGIYVWPDKSCYKGSFKDNEMSGFGIFLWENGNRYEGMWKMSKMHGEGKFTWRNGNCYIGGYADGLKHGDGVFLYADGKTVRGKWIKGNIQLDV